MMKADFVCNGDLNKNYNDAGYAQEELLPGADLVNAKFYRYSLKAGNKVSPVLEKEKMVMLILNGENGYITTPYELYNIGEPSFFFPDFDKMSYTVHAVDDIELIMCVFTLNDWDKKFWKYWNLHLPFFSKYSDGVRYDQDCKGPKTRSWSILQPFQLGHVSIGVVRAKGEGTDEKGHGLLHQWNYCLGDSDFNLTVEDVTVPQKAGDWSYIYPGKDHKLLAKPGKEVFYVWVEYFTDEDLQKYYECQIHNGSLTEAK
ncbi:MAG: hypothetical protein GX796_10890 [Clostridiaceae bacterium]|nr:hypothetical protein [Clostridiaceae bacterium]